MVVISSGVATRGADKSKGSLDKLMMRKVIEDSELSPLLFGDRSTLPATAPYKQIQNYHGVSTAKCTEGSAREDGHRVGRRFDNTTYGHVPQFSSNLSSWDDDDEYGNSATTHFNEPKAQILKNDFRTQTHIPQGSFKISPSSAQHNYSAIEDHTLEIWDCIEDSSTMAASMDDRHYTLTTIEEEESDMAVDKWNGRGHKFDRSINSRTKQQYSPDQSDRRHSRQFVENPNFDLCSDYTFEETSPVRITSTANSATTSPSLPRPGERQDTGKRHPLDADSTDYQADSRYRGVSPSTHIPGKNWENYSDFLEKDCDIPVHNLDPAGYRELSNTDAAPKMYVNRQKVVDDSPSCSNERFYIARKCGRTGIAASSSEISLNRLVQRNQTPLHQTGVDQDARQLRSCDRTVPGIEHLLEPNPTSRTRHVMSSMPDLRSYDPQSVSTSQTFELRGPGSKPFDFRDQRSYPRGFPDQRSDQFDCQDQRSYQFDCQDQRSDQFDCQVQRSDQFDCQDQRSDQFDFRDQNSDQFDGRHQRTKQFNFRVQSSEIFNVGDQRPEFFDDRENPLPYYDHFYQQQQTGPHVRPSPATRHENKPISSSYPYNCPLDMEDHSHKTAPWEVVSDVPSSAPQIYPPTQHHLNAPPIPDALQSWQPDSSYDQLHLNECNKLKHMRTETNSLDLWNIPQLQRQIRATSEMCLQASRRHMFASSADIQKLFSGQTKWPVAMLPSDSDSSCCDMRKVPDRQSACMQRYQSLESSHPFKDSPRPTMRHQMMNMSQHSVRGMKQSLSVDHIASIPSETRINSTNIPSSSTSDMRRSIFEGHGQMLSTHRDTDRSSFRTSHPTMQTQSELDSSVFHRHQFASMSKDLNIPAYQRQQTGPAHHTHNRYTPHKQNQTVSAYPDNGRSVNHGQHRAGPPNLDLEKLPLQRRASLCDDLGLGRMQLQHQSSGYSSETELQQIESNAYSNNHSQEMQTYKKFLHSPSEGFIDANSPGDSSVHTFEESKKLDFVNSNQSSLTKASTVEISNKFFDRLSKETSTRRSSGSSGTSSCTPSETGESRERTPARSSEIFLPPRSFSGISDIALLSCITQSDNSTACRKQVATQSQNININDKPATTTRMSPSHKPISHIPTGHTPTSHIPTGHTPTSHIPTGDTSHIPTDHTATSHLPTSHTTTSHIPTGHTPTSHIPTSHTATSHLPTSHTPTSHIPISHTPTYHKPIFHKSIDHLPTSHILQSFTPTCHTPTFQTTSSHLPADNKFTSQISTNIVPTYSTPTSPSPTNISILTVHTTGNHISKYPIPLSHIPTSQVHSRHIPTSQVHTNSIPASQDNTNSIPTSQWHTNSILTSQEDISFIPTSQGHISRTPTPHTLTSHKPTSYTPTGHLPTNHIPRSHTPPSHIPPFHSPAGHIHTSHTPTSHIPTFHTPTSHIATNHILTSQTHTGHIPEMYALTSDISTNHILTSQTHTGHIPEMYAPTSDIATSQGHIHRIHTSRGQMSHTPIPHIPNHIPKSHISTNSISANNITAENIPTTSINNIHPNNIPTFANHIPISDLHTNQIPAPFMPSNHMPLPHTQSSHTPLSYNLPPHMNTYQPYKHQPTTYQPAAYQPPTHLPTTYHTSTYNNSTNLKQKPKLINTSNPNLTINNSPTFIKHNQTIPTHPIKHSASLLELSSAPSRHEHCYSRATGSQTGGAFQRDNRPRLQGNLHGLQLRYNSSGSLHLSAFGAAHKLSIPFETSILSDELGDRLSTLV